MSLSPEEELRVFIANFLAMNEELRKGLDSTKVKLEFTKNTRTKVNLNGERSFLILQLAIIIISAFQILDQPDASEVAQEDSEPLKITKG
jgi:hypothetical protein